MVSKRKDPLSGYFIKNIGANRGKPRIWLESLEVSSAGMKPGDKFEITLKNGSVLITANPDGSRTVSGKPSKKPGGPDIPIIDINSENLLAIFSGMAAIRLVQFEGAIHLMPLASELRKKERSSRLKHKVRNQIPLSVGSMSHGAGFLSHALHEGLKQAGIESRLSFANEIRPSLLDHASVVNDAWDSKTVPIGAPLQEFAFDNSALSHLERTEVVELGLPCSGASVSGRAKRNTAKAEDHPEVGHLVVGALVILAKVNPAIILLENVVPYASTASASILRNQLRDLGYSTHEKVLSGGDFNALEDRKRWFMVAATEGMHFDWDMLKIPEKKTLLLSDILDDIPEDSPLWSEMTGLKAKQERDIADGKNFMMQIFSGQESSIGTLTKGYAKIRSTDPKIAHPNNPDLLRQVTEIEHARAKQQPPHLIEGLSKTLAHEVLGQSIVRDPVVATGELMGRAIYEFANDIQPENVRQLIEAIATEINDSVSLVVSEIRAPLSGVKYEGPITVSELGATVQDIGNGVGILHKTDTLDHVRLGEVLSVVYPSLKSAPVIEHKSQPAPAMCPKVQVSIEQAAFDFAAPGHSEPEPPRPSFPGMR